MADVKKKPTMLIMNRSKTRLFTLNVDGQKLNLLPGMSLEVDEKLGKELITYREIIDFASIVPDNNNPKLLKDQIETLNASLAKLQAENDALKAKTPIK